MRWIGHVREYDEKRGVGKIAPLGGGQNEKFTVASLRESLSESHIAPGTPLEYELAAAGEERVAVKLELLPVTVTVRWFDEVKGFGFVLFEDEDVFMHSEVVRASGSHPRDMIEGLAIRAWIGPGKRPGEKAVKKIERF